ncbi:hypothetical protein [Thermosinus carboxydivorans]|nr:hypothetical protein [Thermosinus carboxydivorans]
MGEKELNIELIERMTRLESKVDMILMQCPQCQAAVRKHDADIAALTQNIDSTHQRIDTIYRTASIISAAIALFMQAAVFVWQGVRH